MLVQLLQQLQGSRTTDDQRLQHLLLTGCCRWLHALCLEPIVVVNCSVSFWFNLFAFATPHIVGAAVTDVSIDVVCVAIISTTHEVELYSLSVV